MKRRLRLRASWERIKGQRTFWECVARRMDSRNGVVCGNAIVANQRTMKRMLTENSAFLCEFLIDAKPEDK